LRKEGSGGFSIPVVIEPMLGEPKGQLEQIAEEILLKTNNLYSEKTEIVKETIEIRMDNIKKILDP